jgi:hypothetical protein
MMPKTPVLALRICCLALVLSFLGGCGEGTTRPPTEDQVALFGYLYVGEAIHPENGILLSRTRPIDQAYDPAEALVKDALVTLQKEGSARVDTLRLTNSGTYSNLGVMIDSLTTYHLTAVIPGGPTLRASTTTPRPFRLSRQPRAATEGPMVHAEIADSFPIVARCADPEQIFLVDVYCLENWEDARYISPVGPHDHPQSYQEYGAADNPPRHINTYFRLRNLKLTDEGYLISFYGDMMAFYGTYDVGVYAIDANYYSYLYRDHPERNAGVIGGIGVFGSASRRTFRVEAAE